jgi:hypothetical protein
LIKTSKKEKSGFSINIANFAVGFLNPKIETKKSIKTIH